MFLRKSLMVCLLALGWGSAALAGPARNELLRLVPDDMALCLLIENLRSHGQALENSPFLKQFAAQPLGQKILEAPETKKLSDLDEFLKKQLGLTSAQLRDEILGDAIVLAYQPGPDGKPEQEKGLFLLRARDPKLLATLWDRFIEQHKKSSNLKAAEDLEYRGQKYQRLIDHEDKINYCYLHGPLFVVASKEDLLRSILDRQARYRSDEEAPLTREFRLLGVDHPLTALWINPRAFDAALKQRLDESQGAQATALKTFAQYWHAIRGIALSISMQEAVDFTLAVRAQEEQLPEPARRFLAAAAKPSSLWQRFPDQAILTVVTRFDLAALGDLLGSFLTEKTRVQLTTNLEQGLGAMLSPDNLKEMFALLGQEAGFSIFAPASKDANWMPQALAALAIGGTSDPRATELSMWNAANLVATFLVFSGNQSKPGSVSLKAVLQDKNEVKYMASDNLFPPGVQPAFTMKDGYLVLASSPETVRQFRTGTTASTSEGYWFRLSLKELCRYIRERRQAIVQHSAAHNQISSEEAGKQLDKLVSVLETLDRVELFHRAAPGRMQVTFRVWLAQALK